jgi:transcriptional regulator with XRE-family HTH domain
MTPASSGDRARRWYTTLDGQRLRELRHQRGLGQTELAGLAGVSACTVGRLERQLGAPCRTRTLARLAAALGERPATLIAVTKADRVTRSDTNR